MGECRALDVAFALLGMEEVVRKFEVENVCTDGKPRLCIAFRIPEHDWTRREDVPQCVKQCGIRTRSAPLRPIGEGKQLHPHKGRISAKACADSNLLRCTQRIEVGSGEFRRLEIRLLIVRPCGKERLLHHPRRCGCPQIIRECAMHRPQLVLLAERIECRTVGLHTKALRRIAEFGHIAFNRRELLG